MDAPLEDARTPSRMPVDDWCSSKDLSSCRTPAGHGGDLSEAPITMAELSGSGRAERAALALEEDSVIGLRDRYWRHLQSPPWSELDVFNAREVLELLLHFGRSGDNAGSRAAQLLDRFGSLGAVTAAEPAKLAHIIEWQSASAKPSEVGWPHPPARRQDTRDGTHAR